jgi:hypothetical protein
MSVSHGEALAAASKLLRTFGSAPDPKARGREIHAELTRVAAWTQQQGDAISAFGEWLRNYPTPSEIKPRCQQLLDRLR